MSTTVFITREYDDKGQLVSETETTKVVTVAESKWKHFGFGTTPMEVNAEVTEP